MPLGWVLPREPRGMVTLRSALIQLRDMEGQVYGASSSLRLTSESNPYVLLCRGPRGQFGRSNNPESSEAQLITDAPGMHIV